MKKYTFALPLLLAMLGACASEETAQTSNADSLAVVDSLNKLTSTAIADLQIPDLEKAVAKSAKAKMQLASLKGRLQKLDLVKADADVMAIFASRDSLVNLIQYEVLEGKIAGAGTELEEEIKASERLVNDLLKVGLAPIYAEGQYVGLSNAPFLANIIAKIGTPALQCYADFVVAHGKSLGGEYPFMDLSQQMEMVRLGEQLRTNFANKPYVSLAESHFVEAVAQLTDVHLVGEQALFWAANTDFYPNGTELGNYTTFAKTYKGKTKLANVTAKIVENMSGFAGESTTLYVVGISWFDAYDKASKAAFEAVSSGKDLPHALTIKTDAGERHLLAYRFYDSQEKAEKALAKAKALSKEAKIYVVSRDNHELSLLPDGAAEAPNN